MTKAELKLQFQNSYKKDNWMPILKLVFGKISFFTKPLELFEGEEAVKQGYQIGYVDLPNNQTVAIFEIEVADSIIIERNRKGLRDIAAKYIKGTFSAALVFYYSKNQTEYRFSFIAQQSKIDEQTGEHSTIVTAPKRYTYVLGTPFCTTAAKRWIDLSSENEITVDKITDAFSVERLSKEFFDEYKKQYTRFCKFIADDSATLPHFIDHTETDALKAQKPLRDYVKKLLGRLVFLQFLQKKGWMGVPAANKDWKGGNLNFMANLFDKSPYQDNFLDQVLEPLFFNTLNAERTNDIAVDIDTTIKIPYLNGGLFEKVTLDNTHVQLPKHYFSELFEFFNQYNFTIDENDPDDAEVGIDPEMLGHIFENLLEDNKDKGAFYTPKEIVRYMCQESLIAYLHTHTHEALHPSIEKLIRTHKVDDCLQDKPNATLIQKLLVAVKICDPAIGSGAFPMGMLNEIFMVRRLLFGFLGKNQSFSACLVKKEIIQNNIYGVDIEQGAVDIARLRFWLALVVDEDVPQALPNLDYKIVCGNSLISRFPLDCDINEVFKEYNKSEEGKKEPLTLQRYKDEVANYTDEHSEKTTQKRKIEAIKSAFKMYLSFGDRTQIKKLAKKIVSYDGLFGMQEIDLKDANLKKAYDKNEELKNQISNLQNQQQEVLNNKLYENSFEWRFEFPSLLDEGGNFNGFDIVIGNPPYLRIQGIREVNPDFADLVVKIYKSATGSFDLYAIFTERALQVIKNKGIVNFIMPVKWTNAAFGKGLRTIISTHNSAYKIINFGAYQVFNASTYTGLQWYKRDCESLTYYELDKDLSTNHQLGLYLKSLNDKNAAKINAAKLTSESWVLTVGATTTLLNKLDMQPRCMKNIFEKIFQGLATSKDDVYFLYKCREQNDKVIGYSKYLEKEVELERGLVKPLLKGEDVHRYDNISTDRFVIFPYRLTAGKANLYTENEILNEFPLGYEYLKTCEDVLRGREKGRLMNDDFWYRYIYPKNLVLFAKEKLVAPEISLGGNFSYDSNGKFYSTTKIYGYIKKQDIKESYKFWLGLFNSSLFWFYMQNTGYVLRGGYFTFKTDYINPFPVPKNIPIRIESEIVELVDKVLEEKKLANNTKTISLEQQINTLVYKLYELSYEEVLLIEPDFVKRVSVQEYENVNVMEYEAVSVE